MIYFETIWTQKLLEHFWNNYTETASNTKCVFISTFFFFTVY